MRIVGCRRRPRLVILCTRQHAATYGSSAEGQLGRRLGWLGEELGLVAVAGVIWEGKMCAWRVSALGSWGKDGEGGGGVSWGYHQPFDDYGDGMPLPCLITKAARPQC